MKLYGDPGPAAVVDYADRFLAICDRLRLTDIEAAAAAGVSAHLIKECVSAKRLPHQARCRARFLEFVGRYESAQRKGELRLWDEGGQ